MAWTSWLPRFPGATPASVRAVGAGPGATVLSASALFLAASLSFSIQPLFVRMLVPHLGGAPAVWVVALVFFQVALLAGYGYAHALSRLADVRLQVGLHLLLLALAARWLPPAVGPVAEGGDPAVQTLFSLASGIGVPYLALIATTPLLQHWLARSQTSGDPYVLYAASNAGSLAGLLAYPFVLEPALGLGAQSRLWAAGYAASGLLIGTCGLVATRRARPRGSQGPAASPTGANPGDARPIGLRSVAGWVGLAAIPSAWLGASTTYLTTAVAPIPLLWVVPLAVYLLTLIVAFAPPRPAGGAAADLAQDVDQLVAFLRGHRAILARLAVAAAAVGLAVHAMEPAPLVVGVHLVGLFAGALTCHAALAAARPAPSLATAYYLAVAAGGALGGALVAIAAPQVFRTLQEYPLVLAAFVATGLVRPGGRGAILGASVAALATAGLVGSVVGGTAHWFLASPLLGAATVLAVLGAARAPRLAAVVLLGTLLAADASPVAGGYRQERVERSFFGVNRVLTSPDGQQRILLNGLITHGVQSLEPTRSREPQGYYTRQGPLGDVLPSGRVPHDQAVERVSVVGLGAGAVACYADDRRRVRFFEIDPTVVALARDPAAFSYLSLCPPEEVALGDARTSLERVPPGSVDVLVLDAYSGDTIPLHLLTREALALYRRVLAPGGVIALHVSNKFFDFEPLVAALAADAGVGARIREDYPDEPSDDAAAAASRRTASVWTLIGDEDAVAGRLAGVGGWRPLRARPSVRAWTDDFASPLAIRR